MARFVRVMQRHKAEGFVLEERSSVNIKCKDVGLRYTLVMQCLPGLCGAPWRKKEKDQERSNCII